MEPIIRQRRRAKLGVTIRWPIRRLNAPAWQGLFRTAGPYPRRCRQYVTERRCHRSAGRMPPALLQVGTSAKPKRQRNGRVARGSGVPVSTYSAGPGGYDGLFVLKPDAGSTFSRGNWHHGTGSVSDGHRCVAPAPRHGPGQGRVTWGNTSKNLPWTCNKRRTRHSTR